MRNKPAKRHVHAQAVFFDKSLVFSVLAILTLGLVMVASASIVMSEKLFHQPFHFFIRQGLFLVFGLMISGFSLRISMKRWQAMAPIILLLALAALFLVIIPGVGRTVNGSTRWLGIGAFALQVSEFAKLAAVLYFSHYCVKHHRITVTTWLGFLKPMSIFAVMALFLLKEPDFGATVVILTITLGILFMSGVALKRFYILLAVVMCLVALIAIASPYRVHRLTSFINPWQHQFKSGYQLTQSLIAFGNGGAFGVGLGQSVQKLFYLPEAHTDFLFAVLAEELGLVGVIFVLFCFTVLIWRAFSIGRNAQRFNQHFSAYVAYGVGLWMGMQFMVNIGVSVGLLPTKGLTLPLMSYGGSSVLIDCIAIALLLRIDYEARIMQYGMSASKPYRVSS